MLSDIDIAQAATLRPIQDIAHRLGLSTSDLHLYGQHMAKLTQATVNQLHAQPVRAKLILVTAINPTPAGEGKTTTTVGLTDALNLAGYQALACLREPSLGPVFGMKGGATGGGSADALKPSGSFSARTASSSERTLNSRNPSTTAASAWLGRGSSSALN